MEKTKCDNNPVSKEEVKFALSFMLASGFTGLMVSIFWFTNLLIYHPDKLEAFVHRLDILLTPIKYAFDRAFPLFLALLAAASVLMFLYCGYIVWKGRHHVPAILENESGE